LSIPTQESQRGREEGGGKKKGKLLCSISGKIDQGKRKKSFNNLLRGEGRRETEEEKKREKKKKKKRPVPLHVHDPPALGKRKGANEEKLFIWGEKRTKKKKRRETATSLIVRLGKERKREKRRLRSFGDILKGQLGRKEKKKGTPTHNLIPSLPDQKRGRRILSLLSWKVE